MKHIAAIVLCGGQSKRMGQPKAWLPFGDEVLLQRVVRRLSAVASPIVVVSAAGQTLPGLPRDVIITRDAAENRGPLQGIVAGFAALGDVAETAFVSSTDAPFIEPALVRLLQEVRGTSNDIVVPHAFGFAHPLAALYGSSVLSEAARMLSEGNLRLMDLLGRVRTLVVTEDELRRTPSLIAADPRLLCLSNLNTPADYLAALAEVRG